MQVSKFKRIFFHHNNAYVIIFEEAVFQQSVSFQIHCEILPNKALQNIVFVNIYQIFRPITLLKHMLITNQYVG